MHTDQRFAVSRIQFYDNLVCQPGNGRGNTNSRRQVNTSVFRNFTCLDNGCTYMSQETGTQTLGNLRQVNIRIIYFSTINCFTKVSIGCIRSTKLQCMSTGQDTVTGVSR